MMHICGLSTAFIVVRFPIPCRTPSHYTLLGVQFHKEERGQVLAACFNSFMSYDGLHNVTFCGLFFTYCRHVQIHYFTLMLFSKTKAKTLDIPGHRFFSIYNQEVIIKVSENCKTSCAFGHISIMYGCSQAFTTQTKLNLNISSKTP